MYAPSLTRSVFAALVVAVWTSVWICIAAVVALVTWNRDAPLVMARRIWAPVVLWAAGVRYRVEPLPALDPATPHVFVMNHQSMLDIACAFGSIPLPLRFIAKKVLKHVPFLGWYMWLTGMIFVDRSGGSKAVRSLAKAAARIKAGANILVFPEGTRSKDGAILPFKGGPFMLALQAGVPIVPVAIEGSGRVLPSGSFLVRPGEVRLKVGKPILTAGRPRSAREALLREVRAALVELHLEIGGRGTGEDEMGTPPAAGGEAE
jgi:1-acyl-sn-glycerol-3-phosphate acyltransferase